MGYHSQDACLLWVSSNYVLVAAATQILAEQTAVHDPTTSFNKAEAMFSKGTTESGKKQLHGKTLLATKDLGLAVVQASLSVLPWLTWAVYKASSSFNPTPGMAKAWSAAQQARAGQGCGGNLKRGGRKGG